MKSSTLPRALVFGAVALGLPACGSCGRREEQVAPAPAPVDDEDGGRTRFFRPEPEFHREGGIHIPLRRRHREGGAAAVAPAPSIE